MTPLLEEEEVSLHERLLKERTNIQCLEVHGKSKEKGYQKMIKEMCLGEQLVKDKIETSLRENWQQGQFSNKQDRIG